MQVVASSTFVPSVGALCLLTLFVMSLVGTFRVLRQLLAARTWGVRLGKGTQFLAVIGVWFLFAWLVVGGIRSLDDARPGCRRPVIKAELRQIGLAVILYAEDNDEHLPPTLGTVFPYCSDGAIYVVPDSDTAVPRNGNDVDSGLCDFLYFGAEAEDEDRTATTVLATTKPELYEEEGLVCVLYFDGHAVIYQEVPDPVRELWRALSEGAPAAKTRR